MHFNKDFYFGAKSIAAIFAIQNEGGLAQLARAFAWHAKGHRFDSGNLHRESMFYDFVFNPILPINLKLGMKWVQKMLKEL